MDRRLRIKVRNNDGEGEFTLDFVIPLKRNTLKYVVYIILNILTIGILSIVASWSTKLKLFLLFNEVESVEECTYFLTRDCYRSYSIEKKMVQNMVDSNSENIPRKEQQIYFNSNLLTYIYQNNDNERVFETVEYMHNDQLDMQQIYKRIEQLNNNDKSKQLRDIYGPNILDIPTPPFIKWMSRELTRPFHIIQYIGVVVWILEDAVIFSIVLLVCTVSVTLINYILMVVNYYKLNQIGRQQEKVTVSRQTGPIVSQIQIKQNELLPGDLIILKDGMKVPADIILIQGQCIANEGMLTGESVPVTKFNLDVSLDSKLNFQKNQRYILFQGTQILQTKVTEELDILQHTNKSFKDQQKMAIGLVFRTGFTSLKGQLVRSLVFPSPKPQTFMINAVKFLLIYGILCMLASIDMLNFMVKQDFSDKLIFLRIMDCFLWIFPPALPLFFQFNQGMSSFRLVAKKIIATDINVYYQSGDIDTCCFDKTGTLTTNGLIVHGYQQCILNQFKLVNNTNSIINQDNKLLFTNFAAAHSLIVQNDDFLGDVLEIQMFKFSNFQINKEKSQNKEIIFACDYNDVNVEILKVFEYESELQRMSVIAKVNDEYYVFAKGSPEMIQSLSLKNTIPNNFDEQLDQLSIKGFRIIGFGYKKLEKSEGIDLANIKRIDCEQDLEFQGLLLFINPLKKDTQEVILKLKNADIDCKVISGDNVYTSIEMARQSSIVNGCIGYINYENGQFTQVYIDSQQKQKVVQGIDNDGLPNTAENKVRKLYTDWKNFESEYGMNVNLAISGSTFQYLYDIQNNKSPKRMSGVVITQEDKKTIKMIQQILSAAKVFGRQKPFQKQQIIKCLQEQDMKVCMTGDGANDCSAIKQANIGVSFSETEASLSAPFSSFKNSISCVQKIICEGKSNMQTNVEIFRYLLVTQYMRYIAAIMMTKHAYLYSDMNYIYLSYVGSVVQCMMMGFGLPQNELYSKRVDTNLLSYASFISVYFHIIFVTIQFIVQYYILDSNGYIPQIVPKNITEFYREGPLITIMFLTSWFQTIFYPFVLHHSKPFKQWFILTTPTQLFSIAIAVLISYYYLDMEASKQSLKIAGIDQKTANLCYIVMIVVCLVSILHEYLVQNIEVLARFVKKSKLMDRLRSNDDKSRYAQNEMVHSNTQQQI